MSPEERRACGSRGGKTTQQRGNGNRFSAEAAARCGSLGGKTISRDREHMAEIGRLGYQAMKARKS